MAVDEWRSKLSTETHALEECRLVTLCRHASAMPMWLEYVRSQHRPYLRSTQSSICLDTFDELG